MMTEEQLQRAKEIFELAAERDPSERSALLDEACAGDADLRAEVEELLSFLPKSEGFIERSYLPDLGDDSLLDSITQSLGSGRLIGNYKVLEEIGRGGMGAVYRAVRADDEFSKQVAIKLVWPGFDSAEVVKRFRQERQILADLDHPNIARLLDGGTTGEGWPYVVMEYVDGAPVTEYCNERKLSIKERLELFEQVCAAVQYAHRNLVVHRDLKPGNIFVTRDGAVKLLDFGIAKILDPSLRAGAMSLTHTGLYAMTPEYASPEQARGERITTASDVYSLGVTLYELLTGVHPFRFKTRVLHEVMRRVCEDEPARPSLVRSPGFSRKDSEIPAEAGTTNALENTPDKLRRRLQGDLDNVLLKAMRKEPERRYASVEQLSQDIARHLASEPIIAQGLTLSYRAGKLIRRHQAAVTIAVLISFFLIGGAVIAQRQARQARWLNYADDTRQAAQYWAEGNLARMGELLDRHQPGSNADDDEWRGVEWNLLWRLLHRERLILPHQNWVFHAFYTPDGQRLLTTDREGKIQIWDANTGQSLRSFGAHMDRAVLKGMSPDGKMLMTTAPEDIRIWDMETGRTLLSFRERDLNQAEFCVFSPDGRIFALSFKDAKVKLWETATGRLLQTITPNGRWIREMLFSPDGRFLAIGENGIGDLRLWDVKSQRQIAAFDQPAGVLALAFSPEGKFLYAGGRDGRLRVWDVAARKMLREVAAHTELIDGVAVSHDGKLLVTGGDDSLLRVWDAATCEEITTVRNEGPISTLTFSPDDKSLAGVCMRQMRVKVWDVPSLLSSAAVFQRGLAFSVTFSPNGKLLVTGGGMLKFWDSAANRLIAEAPDAGGEVSSLSFSPDGKLLAVCPGGLDAQLRDGANGQIIASLRGHTARVWHAAFSPDGRTLATASDDRTVKLWDVGSRQERLTIRGHDERVHTADFSPDGRLLASGSWDNTIKIWETATGHEIRTLRGHRSPINCVKFSPDGKLIASGSWDYTIRLWDAATGRESQTLSGHGDIVNSIAFFPDGRRLVSGSDDRTVRIWDPATGIELAAFKGHTSRVLTVAVSPDGRVVASGSLDKTTRLWRAATELEVRARPR